jgi:hypothetical protein
VVSALTKGKQKTIKAKTYNPLVEHSAPILSRDPKQMYGKGFGNYVVPEALRPGTPMSLQKRFL